VRIVNIGTGQAHEVEEVSSKDCIVFCAIAKPERFLATLNACGSIVKIFRSYRDHHYFTREEYDRIGKMFQTSGASMLITTEKDAVRIDRGTLPETFPLDSCYYLEIGIDLPERDDEFHSLIENAIRDAA
jgi:tetraacyldisaccharide 4'-kinase